jgi:hypothetical protein
MDNEIIKWLQNWYLSRCDGDWEHENSIKIHTVDNPGWSIKIDIDENDIKNAIPWKLFENSPNDWFGYKIENSYFKAAGDATKLEFLLQLFKDFIEQGEQALPI